MRWSEDRDGTLVVTQEAHVLVRLLGETSRFVFDPARRTVEWRRRFLFRERGGTLPFDAIEQVELQVPIGDDGIPSRRVALRLRDGGELPLTVGYSVDFDGSRRALALRLRALLGLPVEPSVDDEARRLASSGRIIEAVKHVRRETGVSLTEAKRRVDKLAAPPR
jgi:hypothetical protein